MIQILVFIMAAILMVMRMGRVSPPLNLAAVRLKKER